MAPATATTVRDTLDDGELQRAWQGADADGVSMCVWNGNKCLECVRCLTGPMG